MTEPAHRHFLTRQLAAPTMQSAAAAFVAGSLLTAQAVQSWLSSQNLANQFLSTASWIAWASWFTGKPVLPQDGVVDIPFGTVFFASFGIHLLLWLASSAMLAWRCQGRWSSSLIRWGFYGGLWWCLVGLWDWVSLGSQMVGAESFVGFWALTPGFWCAACVAGWMTTWMVMWEAVGSAKRQASGARFANVALWSFIAIYVAVFVTMNWRLYFNLLIPHGDSAMYEEHLWNLLHGNGFRSYLDQGLFLGEHIQVVHLGLIPLYIFWPSHLLLELCESLALALGAWPVYWMTRRHTASQRAALAAAAAYLLYPPMQFLDIEIDLKTFRPEAFGIPIFLLTLDQLDRRNLWGTLLGILGCLTVKEDYAVVLAPLGLWIAVFEGVRRKGEGGSETAPTVREGFDRQWLIFGLALAIGSTLYLYVATRIVMPWFRSGVEIHYASYFDKFGKTPEEIVRTMLMNPGLLFGEFLTASTALYVLAMLIPLAFLPILSPSRLAIGLPLFGILCLNKLAPNPQHQFHAPLVAIVFWALAGGLGSLPLSKFIASLYVITTRGLSGRVIWDPEYKSNPPAIQTFYHQFISLPAIHLIWTSSLAMSIFFSLNPLSLTFWDAGSEMYWKNLYSPNPRAAEFAKMADLIPPSAIVASTDFVHPRYTHQAKSYDYSDYRRKVSGYEDKVPDDTDYIVIDTQHRYSKAKQPADIPEYRDHPDEWELLPNRSDGFFIVLKRRR